MSSTDPDPSPPPPPPDVYGAYSLGALWTLFREVLRSAGRQRMSALHRLQDYAPLGSEPKLLRLHARMREVMLRAREEWDSYDYGEGYFYQGSPRLGITGLRDTAARIRAMDLLPRVEGKSVLEIGSNTGFLALELAPAAREVVGIEMNPYLVEISQLAAEHLGAENVRFEAGRFEDLEEGHYEAVLSFANHHTYDGNTSVEVDEFFALCAARLEPGGLFLFESHPPGYEGPEQLAGALGALEEHFEIQEKAVLEQGSFLDRGRTFVAATRR